MVDNKPLINLRAVLTSLATLSIVGFVGAIWDFQNVKAQVKNQNSRIDVISVIVCKQAIQDKVIDASIICHDVMKGKTAH